MYIVVGYLMTLYPNLTFGLSQVKSNRSSQLLVREVPLLQPIKAK